MNRVYNNDLFAVTTGGEVYKINNDGSHTLVVLNKNWLAGKSRWATQIAHVARETSRIIPILDVKDDNKKNMPVCFDPLNRHFTVIPSEFGSKQLQYLGNEDSGRTAWLWDIEEGKIYKQATYSSYQAQELFGGDTILDTEKKINKMAPVIPDQKIIAAKMVEDNLHVTTEDGLIFAINKEGTSKLIAITSSWVENNRRGKTPEEYNQILNSIIANNSHDDVIAFIGNDDWEPSWYHVASKKFINSPERSEMSPDYIGFNSQHNYGYVFIRRTGELKRIDVTRPDS